MKTIQKIFIASSLAAAVVMSGAAVVLPFAAAAQVVPININPNDNAAMQADSQNPEYRKGADSPSGAAFQIVTCSPTYNKTTGQLDNNCDYNQAIYTFERIIQFVLYIVTPIVLGMMLYTGFKYVTAGGDANMVADAKRMIKPIVFGVFFILAAYLIVYKLILGNLLVSDPTNGLDATTIINQSGK